MTGISVEHMEAMAQAVAELPPLPVLAITVSPDRLRATLSFEPSDPVAAIDREQILAALQSAGVTHGILDAAVAEAVAQGRADALVVAEGLAPVDGSDARFEPLIPDIKDRKPRLDDSGTADFRELGVFVCVQPGTALMRRRPATPGTPGITVLGEPLPPRMGKDQPFAPQLKGAMVDPKDPLQLVAAIAGLPVRVSCGVTVEPVLTVNAVDLSTGNISFEGSVHVLGDVHSGMTIRVQGDVIVGGVVEAAEIEARGHVTIKGGVIGHSEWSVGAGEAHATARIIAGGSVHTRFVEHAIIESGGVIQAQDASRQSLLRAMQKVIIGKGDGRTGHLIGGRAVATLLVHAAYMGSTANVPTQVEVGRNPMLAKALESLDERLHRLEKERADLLRLLAYAQANPKRLGEEVLNKARFTALQVDQQLASCSEERQVLLEQLKLSQAATVEIGQRLYGGVTVRFGDLMHRFDDEREAATLRRVDNMICSD